MIFAELAVRVFAWPLRFAIGATFDWLVGHYPNPRPTGL